MKETIKKILKNRIFVFIFGGILFSTVSVYAVTYFPSNQVTYDNSTSKLNSTDVQGAIDEIYNTCLSSIKSGDYIYYAFNNSRIHNSYIYRSDLNGQNRVTLISETVTKNHTSISDIYVTKDYIYYAYNALDSSGSPFNSYIYRSDLNGQNQVTLYSETITNSDATIDGIYVSDNYIYFTHNYYYSDGEHRSTYIRKMDLNGQNITTITSLETNTEQYSIDSIFIK